MDAPQADIARGDSPLFWPVVILVGGLVEGWLLYQIYHAWLDARESRAAGCPDECLGDLSVAWWGFWLVAWPIAAFVGALILRRILRLFPH